LAPFGDGEGHHKSSSDKKTLENQKQWLKGALDVARQVVAKQQPLMRIKASPPSTAINDDNAAVQILPSESG
jgi:hypothetical protein